MAKSKENKKAKADSSETIKEIYQQEIQAPPPPVSGGLKFVILYLLISFLGGFAGALVRENLINQDLTVKPAISEVKENGEQVLDLEFLLSKEDQTYSKILSELKNQVVGFYKKKKATTEILNSLYLEKDFLGSGLIITSDGWILTHEQVVNKDDFLVVTADKKIYEPLKKVTDPFARLVLIQIAAQNLTPVKFADLNYLQPTDPLLTFRYAVQNHGADIVRTAIQRFAYHDQVKGSDFLLSTERIDHYLKVTTDFDLVYNGAVLFNERSEVAGILFASGRPQIRLAVPAYYLKSAVNNFLSSAEEVIRSKLGVYYLDLAEAVGLPAEVAESKNKGAVLLGSVELKINAIEEGGPAASAGLKAGDIILKVNNEEVSEKNSLTKLIQDYTPGQELTLLILRAGQEEVVKVVIGEM